MEIIRPLGEMWDEWEEFLIKSKTVPQVNVPISIKTPISDLNKYILFNVEQTSKIDFNYNHFMGNNILEVWDYSLSNVNNFIKHGITNVRHVPFVLWDEYKNKLLSYNTDNTYDYDVIFCGWLRGRRRVILEELTAKGIRCKTIPNGGGIELFGKERDKKIAKSKIYLNIHCDDDYSIFELYRCFAWIGINKTIVSETSIDHVDGVIFVDYENIVNKIIEILK
jgi:hypothetical protein